MQTNSNVELSGEIVHVALEETTVGHTKSLHSFDGPHQRLLLVLHLDEAKTIIMKISSMQFFKLSK